MLFGTLFHCKQTHLCVLRIFPQLSYLNGNLAFPEDSISLAALKVGLFTLLPTQSLSQLSSYTLGHMRLSLDFFFYRLSFFVCPSNVGVPFSLYFLPLYSLPM